MTTLPDVAAIATFFSVALPVLDRIHRGSLVTAALLTAAFYCAFNGGGSPRPLPGEPHGDVTIQSRDIGVPGGDGDALKLVDPSFQLPKAGGLEPNP